MRKLRELLSPFTLELLALQHLRGKPSKRRPRESIANDNVRAQALHRTKHVGVETADHRTYGNDGAHADDDAQHRQRRSQRIPAQCIQGESHYLAQVSPSLLADHLVLSNCADSRKRQPTAHSDRSASTGLSF